MLRQRLQRAVIALAGAATVAVAAFVVITPQNASASPVIGFNPAYIINDNIFTNSQSMTAAQIQSFLNSKVPNCDTNGTQIASEYGSNLTHAQYASSRGWSSAPFTCLKDYSENGIVAAQIIYNAAQQYGINPQVLLVLLQKEQGLVTDTWPISSQYRSATGYGCPDTAPCDSQYYGLTNQVNWAAKMFHAIMIKSPTWYSPYTVGNNFIGYNPNSSCGGTTVNIQNIATAALYDYTPYQPNQAALNAGYGSGDSCGAYGNRNFYLYFSDWFGSPQYGNLVRTADNASVYLVSGANKYPISDVNVLSSLYPLGGITFVSQTYLDGLTTGATMGRVIRANNGTVYYYDAGIKLPFSSCSQVADYGSSCGASILLQDFQVNALYNGPSMTNLVVTTTGKRFYIAGGVKKEVYDDQSLTQASITSGVNVLSDGSVSALPYGTPVIRDGAFVTGRSSGQLYVYSNNTLYKIDPALQSIYSGFGNAKAIDDQSITALAPSTTIGGYIKSTAGANYILTSAGKIQVTDPTQWSTNFITVSDAVLSQIPNAQSSVSGPYTVSFTNGGTIYYLQTGSLRPITSWAGLLSLNANPTILTLPTYYLNNLQQGGTMFTPGTLIVSQSNPTVYLVDGINNLVPMSTFSPSTELGVASLSVVGSGSDSAYTKSSSLLSAAVQCGSQQGLAIGGNVYPYALTSATYSTLSATYCSMLNWKSTAPAFLLANNGTIFKVTGGQKQPIASYQKYLSLGGNGSNTITASSYALGFFTDGQLLQ